ncbi:hypothetical protein PHYSODRAFT_522930, partial [Phytophthora sojae]
ENWRRKHPKNPMAPMIEICDGHLYDMLYLTSLQNLEMMILCDSQPDERPGSRGAVSLIGDGSEAFPIRVGMTCLQQIRYYLSILTRSDCTTMLHIDSTHSMVIHGYSIFCVWIFGPKLPLFATSVLLYVTETQI